jgi:GH24 family phage-related lysozyme (muramidase)
LADWEGHKAILANGNYRVDDTDKTNNDKSWTTYGGLVIAQKINGVWTGVNGFSTEEAKLYYNTGVPKVRYEIAKNTYYSAAEEAINQFAINNKISLNQNQFDALFSFVWNSGVGILSRRDVEETANYGKGSYSYDFLDVLIQPGFLTNPTEQQIYEFNQYWGNYIRSGTRQSGMWARRMDELEIFWGTDLAYTTSFRDMPNQGDTAREWLKSRGLPGLG